MDPRTTTMRGTALAAALAAALLLPVAARAGYRIQEVDPEFPAEVTSYWFQDGKARVDGALEGLTMLIDVRAGEGWLVDAGLKRYAGGPLGQLAAELARLEEDAAEAAAEDAGGEEEPSPPERPRSVEVKEVGPGERILGYDTRRYAVRVDGELIEELWVAPKVAVAAEVDPSAFADAMRKMLGEGPGAGQGYEESGAYQALRASGFPLRQVLHFVGEKSTLEVTAVTVSPFPPGDFAVPKGFTRVGYAQLLFGEGD